MGTIKVFISSEMSAELDREREIAERVIAELDLLPNRFESWPAGPIDARERSLSEVADSEIFVLILGRTISDPVLAEYEAARESIPDRILAFVKEVPRSPKAKEFFKRVRRECVYKPYRDSRQLGPLVQDAIRSLMRDLLKRKDHAIEQDPGESIIDETIELGPGENWQWEFQVEEGDYITGIVDEADGEPLDVFLFDRTNYVKWKNDAYPEYYGGKGKGAFDFSDIYVEESGTWYLIIRNNARYYDREVKVELTRLTFR